MDTLTGWFENLHPWIPPRVGTSQEPLLLDSGFNGDLMLPEEKLAELGWPLAGMTNGTLADGSSVPLEVYEGNVEILGRSLTAYAARTGGTTGLAGMNLFLGFRIILEPATGVLRVEPAPSP